MPIKYPDILNERVAGRVREWTSHDSILYALGIGMGSDPVNEAELQFVYEKDQRAVPTLAAVLTRGLGLPVAQLGIDYRLALHGEQSIVWHRALTPGGAVVGECRVVAVYDKGDKGAVVILKTALSDRDTGEPVATVEVTSFARGDGNCGAPTEGAPTPHTIPTRTPDMTKSYKTRNDLALIYRLSGDLNPLHADPVAAKAAGFPRPILHGLCTYGIACRAIMDNYTNLAPEALASLATRFSAPVFPGEEITFDLWRDNNIVSFEARVRERNVTVLKNGRAELRPN